METWQKWKSCMIRLSLKVECRLAEEPQECTARGCCMILENWQDMSKFLASKKRR
ncbi:MAG: hypothetical protein IJ968_03945 [Clostridia bacterium]|nr:hypothetical protein [Clostridia bacterium]